MKYPNITRAIFQERPNRFIAKVEIPGDSTEAASEHAGRPSAGAADGSPAGKSRIETVHVKNTGRCRELLVPGCEVWLVKSDDPKRKTRYDLVAVRKSTGVLFNIDSQAPNKVAREWLDRQGFHRIVPEYTYGNSRLDFYMEMASETPPASGHRPRAPKDYSSKGVEKYLMEVKGCTLEMDGIGYFPDAPTERGTKHVRELIRAAKDGYHAMLCFVIQMDGVSEVKPNTKTDPAFAEAIKDARDAGVEIVCLCCHVEPDSIAVADKEYFHHRFFRS